MKLNLQKLLDQHSIECHRLEDGKLVETRAAIVTIDNANELRQQDGPDVANVRFGDIAFETKSGNRGIAQAGHSAGLFLKVGTTVFPFTGRDYLGGWRQLQGFLGKGYSGGMSLANLRAASRFVRDGLFMAAQDVARPYPEEVRGQAYYALFARDNLTANLAISFEELSRHARAGMYRSQIKKASQAETDIVASIEDVFQSIQVKLSSSVDLDGGVTISQAAIRNIVLSNSQLYGELFSQITRLPVADMDVGAISSEDITKLCVMSKNLGVYHDLKWVEKAQGAICNIMGDNQASLELVSIDGRDILVLMDSALNEAGKALIYSWPSSKRATVATIGDESFVIISPDEVPTAEDLKDLEEQFAQSAYAAMTSEAQDTQERVA